MRKSIESMSDRELLMELVADKRRADRARRIKTIVWLAVAAALLVLALIYLPPLAARIRQFNQTMDQLQQAATSANEFFDNVKGIGYDKLAETVESVNQAAARVREITDGLSEAGLETLEESIGELNDMIARLRGFFGG